jgi:tRNA dimethylallyltransferase
MSNKLLVVIGGPTGVGKTAAAIQLATHFQTEIISADSRQIYSELNIGVGKPTAEQLTAVPHHLIGHTSIMSSYSVGQYVKDALERLDDLYQRHDIVVLSGGTGLYIKSLLEGIDPIPQAPENITAYWTSHWKKNGTESLAKVLEKLDPEYAKTVDLSNPMRLIRALAVSESSGVPYSSYRKGVITSRQFHAIRIVLELPREELYARIDQRVVDMMNAGWLEEAKSLIHHRHLKSLQTVGYKELFEHIDGLRSLPETIAAIQQSTRRYAKRQMTWFRNQGEWVSFHPGDIASMINVIKGEGGKRKGEET